MLNQAPQSTSNFPSGLAEKDNIKVPATLEALLPSHIIWVSTIAGYNVNSVAVLDLMGFSYDLGM